MNISERHDEIMRILIVRRSISVPELSDIFKVSEKTVRRDIHKLMVNYPIESFSGNGGGIALLDTYHPYSNIISNEVADIILHLSYTADNKESQILMKFLKEYASYFFKEHNLNTEDTS